MSVYINPARHGHDAPDTNGRSEAMQHDTCADDEPLDRNTGDENVLRHAMLHGELDRIGEKWSWS